MPIKHAFTSEKEDEADATLVRPSNWNADHIGRDSEGNEAFKVDDAGVLTLAKQTSGKVYRASAQSIPNASWTKVNYDTKVYDIQSDFDVATNHRFVAAVAGIYLIISSLSFHTMPADTIAIAGIRKNGYEIGSGRYAIPAQADMAAVALTIIDLAIGNYIEGWAYQNSGNAHNVYAGSSLTFLIVHKIG